VRAVIFTAQPNRSDPLIDQSGILASAGDQHDQPYYGEVSDCAASSFKPGKQTCLDVRRELELYRTSGFLLDDSIACSDLLACDEGSDLN
jgi:hypothetical protein